jgi:hypothetical protein
MGRDDSLKRYTLVTMHGPVAVVPSLLSGHGLPDFSAAIRALKYDIDLRHAPIGRDVANDHRQNSDATGTDYRDGLGLDLVMMHIGWHVGSPLHDGSKVDFSPTPT